MIWKMTLCLVFVSVLAGCGAGSSDSQPGTNPKLFEADFSGTWKAPNVVKTNTDGSTATFGRLSFEITKSATKLFIGARKILDSTNQETLITIGAFDLANTDGVLSSSGTPAGKITSDSILIDIDFSYQGKSEKWTLSIVPEGDGYRYTESVLGGSFSAHITLQ